MGTSHMHTDIFYLSGLRNFVRQICISNQSSNQCESNLLIQLLNATSWRLPLSECILPGLPFPPLLPLSATNLSFFPSSYVLHIPVAIRQYTLDRLQLCQRAHTFTHTLTQCSIGLTYMREEISENSQTQGEHENSNQQGPKPGFEPRNYLLRGDIFQCGCSRNAHFFWTKCVLFDF